MTAKPKPPPGRPGAVPGELLFLPLGGAGEIGMNMNLFGYGGRWLMVDCGVTFGGDTTPGVDVIMPDPAFIVDRVNELDGLVLTHAHEDHIGAVPLSLGEATLSDVGNALHSRRPPSQA